MKPSSDIVEGGGWVTRTTVRRPWTHFFVFLSIIWLGVAICATFPFWDGWPQSFGYLEGLCIVLLVLQPVFDTLAIIFWLKEKPRTITEQQPNPDYDIGKLY